MITTTEKSIENIEKSVKTHWQCLRTTGKNKNPAGTFEKPITIKAMEKKWNPWIKPMKTFGKPIKNNRKK